MSNSSEKVGLIGLGIMGTPMARNVLKAGFPLVVWNRTRAKADAIAKDGGVVAATPRELARQVDVLIVMVTNSPDVEAVLFGADGAIEGARSGQLWIDMSTISPDVERSIAERAASKGVRTLDAPVSGGEIGAIEARLSIMVGGDAVDVPRAMPILSALGETIVHVGPHGAGQVVKLANQIAVVLNNLGVSEALVFAAGHGIDLEKTRQVIAAGAGSSWAMQNYAPKILAGDFRAGFMIDLQQKDLRLVLEAAFGKHLALPGTALTHELYSALQRDGGGRQGNHALIRAIEQLSGLEARQAPDKKDRPDP